MAVPSLHHKAALGWLFISSMALRPIMEEAEHPELGPLIAQGIALVTGLILLSSLMLRWERYRRAFCWTDAVERFQARGRQDADLLLIELIGYLRRTAAAGAFCALLGAFPLTETGWDLLSRFIIALPVGAMMLIILYISTIRTSR